MSQEYFNACVPEPYTILGLRLRPLSIGHFILLHRIHSPFINGKISEANEGDFSIALIICSMTFEEGLEFLDAGDKYITIRKWIKGVHNHNRKVMIKQHTDDFIKSKKWIELIKYRVSSFLRLIKYDMDWTDAQALFVDYLTNGTKEPTVLSKGEKTEINKCPPLQMLIVSLMNQTTLTEKEIYNRPYVKCVWDYITLGIINGNASIKSEEDMKEIDKAMKEIEEYINKCQT